MTIDTPTPQKAMEIANLIRENTGDSYHVHSTGICGEVSSRHYNLIIENFKGQGVYVDGARI